MLGLTDTHCHLNLNLFQEDLPDVLARAWDQGVQHILIPGIDLETSRLAVELSQRDPRLHAAVGFHPNDALKWDESAHQALEELASAPGVFAIGEIGLDYYRDHAPRDVQMRVLQAQLDLANTLNKPVVLHSRDSFDHLWKLLSAWQESLQASRSPLASRPGVLHSFEGDTAAASQVISHHFYLGISGPVTFKNAVQRQQTVTDLPLSALLLETDAPFLAPHPHRGMRNEPAFVGAVAEKIAALKQLDIGTVVQTCAQNANELFLWD